LEWFVVKLYPTRKAMRAEAPPDNDILLTHIQLVSGMARKLRHGDCSKEKL
jgi:hypothetical protein